MARRQRIRVSLERNMGIWAGPHHPGPCKPREDLSIPLCGGERGQFIA